jgi:nucleotide-binding universal stress UspA family protein
MEAQHSRRTVVVGIDGSRSALRAVQWAVAEAARRKLPLRIVMALE